MKTIEKAVLTFCGGLAVMAGHQFTKTSHYPWAGDRQTVEQKLGAKFMACATAKEKQWRADLIKHRGASSAEANSARTTMKMGYATFPSAIAQLWPVSAKPLKVTGMSVNFHLDSEAYPATGVSFPEGFRASPEWHGGVSPTLETCANEAIASINQELS